MKNLICTVLLLFALASAKTIACTTAVISGKATADGRSMLWKVRDTESLSNSMRFFNDGKYSYLGLINSEDIEGKNVWGGSNSAGFAIMNSASFNVNQEDSVSIRDQEGAFMKLALQTCGSLEDFEQLLNSRPRPMGLASHFGVIDANGGAAFYEVNNRTWTKFDANTAPDGYVIRTNFSETGTPDVGYGFIRRQTAESIFKPFQQNKSLSPRVIMQQFSRCLIHPVLAVDYREEFVNLPYSEKMVASDDLITRHGTASNIVIQGVKKGESPDMNTVWVQVGFPSTSVSMPLWVRGGENIPNSLQYNKELKNSPLSAAATAWKDECFPIGRSDGYHYLKIGKLLNKEQSGYMQRIEKVEDVIFKTTDEKLNLWRKRLPQKAEIEQYYKELNQQVNKFYGI